MTVKNHRTAREKQEINLLKEKIRQKENEILFLKSSWSWKITAPLRKTRDLSRILFRKQKPAEMRVSGIMTKNNKGWVRASATVNSLAAQARDFALWFEIPEKYSSYINKSGNAFATALLIPAMVLKEDLTIEEKISKTLYQNLVQAQKLMLSWPETDVWHFKLHRTKIKCQGFEKEEKTSGEVGSFFSGGVDSFYNLLKIKNLKSLIFVWGFDIPLKNKKIFNNTLAPIKEIAKQSNKKLIVVKTNLRNLYAGQNCGYLNWDMAHGAALASIAHLLSSRFRAVYIPSSGVPQKYPDGVQKDLDPLWSKSNLKIDSFGTALKRKTKLAAIKDNALAQKYLRVCFENTDDQYNCSKCEKCLRTMLQLKALKSLDKFKVFKRLNPKLVDKINPSSLIFSSWEDIIRELDNSSENIAIKKKIKAMLKRRRLATNDRLARKPLWQKIKGIVWNRKLVS